MRQPSQPASALLWEQEELRRSAYVATRRKEHPVSFERYLSPGPDSAYPLEYAYYLLGNIQDKLVVDLGCGAGENALVLAKRGARVIGIDLSPELLELAARACKQVAINVTLLRASAYETGLGDKSADIVFCMAVLHHLNLDQARAELMRILRPGGFLILREPVRDSLLLTAVRKLFPRKGEDVSAFERPLKAGDLTSFADGFVKVASRRFRLPHLPIVDRIAPNLSPATWRLDRWLLGHCSWLNRYATIEVSKLVKPVANHVSSL